MGAETLEDFSNMLTVFLWIIRVDQDVIKIYNHGDIHYVSKNVIHEALESNRSISKFEWHNQPFERPIVDLKGSFPLISVCDAD